VVADFFLKRSSSREIVIVFHVFQPRRRRLHKFKTIDNLVIHEIGNNASAIENEASAVRRWEDMVTISRQIYFKNCWRNFELCLVYFQFVPISPWF
jgi:hypothetical protein